MTIRAKLLIVIPLLVLAANTMIFFLFRSSTLVQDGYDHMLNRILAYKQAVQASDQSLQSLYDYLLDPGPGLRAEMTRTNESLRASGAMIEAVGLLPALAPQVTGYLNLIGTLADQERHAAEAAATPKEALARYESAEKTAEFIREEGQRLVDLDLGIDQPVFRHIQQENKRMRQLGVAVIAVQTLLSVCLAVWVSRSVTEPVGRLVRMARQVSEGRPQAELPDARTEAQAQAKDELGMLTQAFLQMLASLHEAAGRDKERLERERFVKELELRALQSQIQPHFLFNALNVLSKLSLLEGAERTSDLIVSMSRLIRYRLRKLDEPVSLREELGHVTEYAALQQARFGSRIRFETDVDENALSAMLPALTVQPLVENAFVHGIESIEAGAAIRLAVAVDGADAVIGISDNGVGMDEATRRSLLRLDYDPAAVADNDAPKRPEPASMSAGIGTSNVFRRLQLFTGRSDAVAIRSAPGEGTTFTIRIPMKPKEEQAHVPFDDRG
ncbi:sensor histidine kinase [Paenibacillus lycopersici]|uniref:histidine kinase n=1 Tax=Paenibacillus lycopersici TaxID=2704462 RepID=A0A6C0FQH9_9BACL|nr:sensor histidine kinase [Paenibacillus lycopersici]QHT59396.1 sensor histidine kinase [Paenibacillus lycopersici]